MSDDCVMFSKVDIFKRPEHFSFKNPCVSMAVLYSMLPVLQVSVFIREQEEEHGLDTAEELEHNAMVADIFKSEDVDRDGALSLSEFSGARHDEL